MSALNSDFYFSVPNIRHRVPEAAHRRVRVQCLRLTRRQRRITRPPAQITGNGPGMQQDVRLSSQQL